MFFWGDIFTNYTTRVRLKIISAQLGRNLEVRKSSKSKGIDSEK